MRPFLSATIVLMLFLASGARAHTGLTASTPIDGAVLTHSPAQLALQFPTAVRLIKLELLDADGAPVELGDYRPAGAATSLEVALPELAGGHYTANWTVMGGDTHKMTGSLRFSIAAE